MEICSLQYNFSGANNPGTISHSKDTQTGWSTFEIRVGLKGHLAQENIQDKTLINQFNRIAELTEIIK